MTIDELKKNQEDAKVKGASCLPYPQCVEQIENAKQQAQEADTTINSNSGSKTISIQDTINEQQLVKGVDNNLLIIAGIIVFVIIILLMGILIALNRIANKN